MKIVFLSVMITYLHPSIKFYLRNYFIFKIIIFNFYLFFESMFSDQSVQLCLC
jgi:hypothetical protein